MSTVEDVIIRRLVRVLAAATYTAAAVAVIGGQLLAGVLVAGLALTLWVAAGTRLPLAPAIGTRDFDPPRPDHPGPILLGPQNRSERVCAYCGHEVNRWIVS